MPRSYVHPFRFLDLPVELQRHVFRKYFEDQWNVDALYITHDRLTGFLASVQQDLWQSLPSGKADTNYVHYDFKPALSLFLVNRQIHHEAKHAMAHSRTGTYSGHLNTAGDDVRTSWDKAITTINADYFGNLHYSWIRSWQQRFCNLKEVKAGTFLCIDSEDTYAFFKSKPLKEILIGKHDVEAAKLAKMEFLKQILGGKEFAECLVGLKITWTHFHELISFWEDPFFFNGTEDILDLVGPLVEGLKELWVQIEFQIDENGCFISGKYLTSDIMHDSRSDRLDATMDVIMAKLDVERVD
ncbi:hypothetical protein H2198_000221 [Neophaeococcomyces mojaviensis]|uniref:Uncharacterized protein n=1 Tax=Neophaeococcomyces mojaviensis TaxID=3383035 RepID=A0ACC3ALD1_9EURO|nr:hypothetical protein H2198_000221 [Knufia sp. JES_112]